MQNYYSHGPDGGSTCGEQDYQGDTVSHGGSIHQGGLRYNRNLHTQRPWNVFGGRHIVGGFHEFSSYGTPESISVWMPSHIAHTCRDGYLRHGKTKKVSVLRYLYIISVISGFPYLLQILLPVMPLLESCFKVINTEIIITTWKKSL